MLKKTGWTVFIALAFFFGLIMFTPPGQILIPASLPKDQQEAHRIFNFERIANFRDLGGYQTSDGRRVRWGLLYRSGSLAQASRWDLEQIQRLNLTTVIDLRTTTESETAPNRQSPKTDFEYLQISVSPPFPDTDASPGGAYYRQLATTNTPHFARFLRVLIDTCDDGALMWHGDNGLHRTGFASAIVLRILGVTMETIEADYLLPVNADWLDISAKNQPSPLWLHAAFEAIDQQWGSFGDYVHEGLKVSPEDIKALQKHLLYNP
ncbi:MAG: tyrosine-protein phosphatase [Parahaliea sp.]